MLRLNYRKGCPVYTESGRSVREPPCGRLRTCFAQVLLDPENGPIPRATVTLQTSLRRACGLSLQSIGHGADFEVRDPNLPCLLVGSPPAGPEKRRPSSYTARWFSPRYVAPATRDLPTEQAGAAAPSGLAGWQTTLPVPGGYPGRRRKFIATIFKLDWERTSAPPCGAPPRRG